MLLCEATLAAFAVYYKLNDDIINGLATPSLWPKINSQQELDDSHDTWYIGEN